MCLYDSREDEYNVNGMNKNLLQTVETFCNNTRIQHKLQLLHKTSLLKKKWLSIKIAKWRKLYVTNN